MGETERRKRGVVSGEVRGAVAANSCLENEDNEKTCLVWLHGCQDQNTDEQCTYSICVCIIHILFLTGNMRVGELQAFWNFHKGNKVNRNTLTHEAMYDSDSDHMFWCRSMLTHRPPNSMLTEWLASSIFPRIKVQKHEHVRNFSLKTSFLAAKSRAFSYVWKSPSEENVGLGRVRNFINYHHIDM